MLLIKTIITMIILLMVMMIMTMHNDNRYDDKRNITIVEMFKERNDHACIAKDDHGL